MIRIRRIIAGGQTGADRAAFDFALEHGFGIGGYIPRGRRAEDGPLPETYPNLTETPEKSYAVRTELNVRHSDATLILSHGPLTGGSRLTAKLARRHRKPALHLDFAAAATDELIEKARRWLAAINCESLNVAGPRASTDPEIYAKTKSFLERLFAGQ
ncbi:MAG: putative molybdenum carrier protein [Acidobacteria bacterium]|nr:putative molybdenum carrier protein [Acidobacteriota bacterium]